LRKERGKMGFTARPAWPNGSVNTGLSSQKPSKKRGRGSGWLSQKNVSEKDAYGPTQLCIAKGSYRGKESRETEKRQVEIWKKGRSGAKGLLESAP